MKKFLKTSAVVLVLAIVAALVVKNNIDKNYFDDYDDTLALNAKTIENTQKDGYRLEKITFDARAGETVPALIAFPKNATEPVPVVVFLHGIGQKKDFIEEICQPFVDAGYALACFDQFTRGERKVANSDGIAGLRDFRARGWKTVNDTRRFVDYLATRDDVNLSRIYLMGASYGAITGATAAAFDKRFAAAMLVYGGADIDALMQSRASEEELGTWLPLVKAFGKAYLGVLDPARYAKDIAPRPTLLQNGSQDSIISKAAAEALQNAVQEPKTIIWYDSDHPDDPELVNRIMEDAIAWLNEKDKHIADTLAENLKIVTEAGVDPAMAALLHTSWKMGDTHITFIAPDKAAVTGGIISALSSEGLKATVAYNDGKLAFTAMGQDRVGTWDGATLTIDGHRAKRVWETPTTTD